MFGKSTGSGIRTPGFQALVLPLTTHVNVGDSMSLSLLSLVCEMKEVELHLGLYGLQFSDSVLTIIRH